MTRWPETQKMERLKQRFVSSSDVQKIVFLARLSHSLTIHGRAFWLDLIGEEQTAAFKGLNELQHKISQDIGHLAEGTNCFPAQDIWESLQETAAHYRLSAHLQQSLVGLSSVLAVKKN